MTTPRSRPDTMPINPAFIRTSEPRVDPELLVDPFAPVGRRRSASEFGREEARAGEDWISQHGCGW